MYGTEYVEPCFVYQTNYELCEMTKLEECWNILKNSLKHGHSKSEKRVLQKNLT